MKMAFLSKKETSPTQPLDAGIIKLWKVKRKGKLYVCSKIDRQKTASEIVKSVNLLIAIQWGKKAWDSINCRLVLLVVSLLPLLELHVFTFYLKFTNLTTQVDLSSLPVAALPNSFQSY